jgi:peroxiredoxin
MEKNLAADLPFEMLADPQKKIFHSYGVQSSLSGMFAWGVMRDYSLAMKAGLPSGMLSSDGGIKGHPADFIIDKDGRIAYVHYGRNYRDSLSVDQVVTIARELKLKATARMPERSATEKVEI